MLQPIDKFFLNFSICSISSLVCLVSNFHPSGLFFCWSKERLLAL
jgi:hypothetical protein